jgi:hypothetical protein
MTWLQALVALISIPGGATRLAFRSEFRLLGEGDKTGSCFAWRSI